jgi:hypothetical protein
MSALGLIRVGVECDANGETVVVVSQPVIIYCNTLENKPNNNDKLDAIMANIAVLPQPK